MPDFAAAAEQAIAALVGSLQPQGIVWFGSASRGQATADSDLDLLVVVPRSAGERRDLERRALVAIWAIRAPIDLLIYYADEVAAKRGSLGSVVREALETGRVVHGHV